MRTKPVRVDDETFDMIEDCERNYREHHPELDKVVLSKNKIIFEMGKFYLKGTNYERK